MTFSVANVTDTLYSARIRGFVNLVALADAFFPLDKQYTLI